MWKFRVDADAKQFEDDLSMPSHYQLIDDYVLQDGKKHPFSIVVPGGSYRCVANFIEGKPIAQKLNQKGISAFILYYRTNEQARYPAPMDDTSIASDKSRNERFFAFSKHHITKDFIKMVFS